MSRNCKLLLRHFPFRRVTRLEPSSIPPIARERVSVSIDQCNSVPNLAGFRLSLLFPRTVFVSLLTFSNSILVSFDPFRTLKTGDYRSSHLAAIRITAPLLRFSLAHVHCRHLPSRALTPKRHLTFRSLSVSRLLSRSFPALASLKLYDHRIFLRAMGCMHSLPVDFPGSSGKIHTQSRRRSILRLSRSSAKPASETSSVSADESWCASNDDQDNIPQSHSQKSAQLPETEPSSESQSLVISDSCYQDDPDLRAEIIQRKKSAVGRAVVHLEQTEARSRCPPVLRPIDRPPSSSQRLIGAVTLFERIAATAEARRVAQDIYSSKLARGDIEVASQFSMITSSSTNSLNTSQSSTVNPGDVNARRFQVKRTLSLAGVVQPPLPSLIELRM